MHLIKFSPFLFLLTACLPDPVEEAGPEKSVRQTATMCPAVYDPVCGTARVVCMAIGCEPERKTFGNSCEAEIAEFSVTSEGRCTD